MKVGDLVREKTRMKRKCSLGIVLEVSQHKSLEYFVHFFDDSDDCWMSKNFVEVVNASR